ncbi:MAG TPA: hypothetical protein VFJ58_14140 [Armatimonadota bacterium]|nr:hypothetical protein [Armatimonadota bacterium]
MKGFTGKLTAIIAALGTLALAGAATANDSSSASKSAGDKTSSPASQNSGNKTASSASLSPKESLDRLIAANLQETANLKAELSGLKGNHSAMFVWMVMIQEHTYDANMLEVAEKEMGSAPTTFKVSPAPPMGSQSDMIKATMQSQNDLLKIAEAAKPMAKGRALTTIRELETAVRHHLNLLLTLSKGYTVTGA